MFAPAAVPKPVLEKLNADIVKVLSMAEVQQRLGEVGLDITPSTSAQLASFVKSETIRWGKVVKEAGISAD